MSGAARPWSLSSRLRLQVVVAAALPALLAVLLGYTFLVGSAKHELHALVEEELSEATLRLPVAWTVADSFEAVAQRCQSEHPEFPMAWRVIETASGRVLEELGQVSLLRRVEDVPGLAEGVVDFGGSIGGKVVVVDEERSLQLLIDGSVLDGSAQTYLLASSITVAFCVVLAVAAGGFMARRIRRMFARVAQRVSGVGAVGLGDPDQGDPDQGESEQGELLPDEIRDVAGQLQVVLQQTRAASEEARVFTMSLAHELRSPVQNLIGQSEVALMRTRDVASYESTLSAHLAELVNFSDALDNLLTYCTKAQARVERYEQFDLVDEAQIRVRREQQRGERKQVAVSLSHRGDTRMCGDREAVMRGVRNVVANAVDWTPSGGAVTIEIFGDDAGVHIRVEDGGPGLPVELRERVFEPFFQGPAAGARRIGYGLGLAMTKKVVDAHGGRITVTDAASGGARFEIDMSRNALDSDSAPAGLTQPY